MFFCRQTALQHLLKALAVTMAREAVLAAVTSSVTQLKPEHCELTLIRAVSLRCTYFKRCHIPIHHFWCGIETSSV